MELVDTHAMVDPKDDDDIILMLAEVLAELQSINDHLRSVLNTNSSLFNIFPFSILGVSRGRSF